MLGESKATGTTFYPSQLSLCLKWGVLVKRGESVDIPQNLAMKVILGLPGDPLGLPAYGY